MWGAWGSGEHMELWRCVNVCEYVGMNVLEIGGKRDQKKKRNLGNKTYSKTTSNLS